MDDATVDTITSADGSLILRPHGVLGAEHAVELRHTLVHAVRHVRPLRLILDLADVRDLDPINLGTLAAAGVAHHRLRHVGMPQAA